MSPTAPKLGKFRRLAFGALLAGSLFAPATVRAQQYYPGEYYPGTSAGGYVPPGAPIDGPSPPISDSEIRPKADYLEESPLEIAIGAALRDSRWRLEYLHWNIEDPGKVLLGEEMSTVQDPRVFFPVFEENPPFPQLGVARVEDLNDVSLANVPGMRGTFNWPLAFGEFELSGFLLHQASDHKVSPELPTDQTQFFLTDRRFIATSFRENNQLSNLVQLYNEGFRYDYSSDVWGTEALALFNVSFPYGLRINPLAGLKYMEVDELLKQDGLFTDAGTTVRSEIDSETWNHYFGPVLGVRAELANSYFTLGLEPKVTFAMSDYQIEVRTNDLRGVADPETFSQIEDERFAPIGELNAYARCHVNKYFTVHVGWTGMAVSHASRPGNTIFYNDNGADAPPDVRAKDDREKLLIYGLSVGGEFCFR